MTKGRNIEAELLQSMRQAVDYAKGSRKGYGVHTFGPDDVRLIRAATKKSQADFARCYGLALRTLQKWESGATQPTGPAMTLLRLIKASPRVVQKALARVA